MHCLKLEKLGIPTVPIVTEAFAELVKARALKDGMPFMRFGFTPHPITGKSALVHREYVEGTDPITGKPLMKEIVELLTRPLSKEEKKEGELERSVPRFVGADSEDALQQVFLENHWTDFQPIVLPTEERVAEMLKGTSHRPDEIVGEMRPAATHEAWQYTVEKVAVNAVMAGAKPDYLPVILALASTGLTSLFSSTTSFARMAVVNGPIRDQVLMNSGIGALGPFNHANATIGRAWTLMSINLGGGAVPGETYMGSIGNNLNYNNICFAENEEKSPWHPFHVQKGFKPEESIVSILSGWSYVSQLGISEDYWRSNVIRVVSALNPPGTPLGGEWLQPGSPGLQGGLTLLLDPLVARDFREREGFDSKEKLAKWFYENTLVPVDQYWSLDLAQHFHKPLADKGVEPYASWAKLPKGKMIPVWATPNCINTIVVGGGTNPGWYAGDFGYLISTSIDTWR